MYACLYAFIRAAQGTCIAAYRHPRLYTKGAHWGVLVPLPSEFVAAIRIVGLDAILAGTELNGVHRSSLLKCGIGLATFDIDWDSPSSEVEYKHEAFCLYDYDMGRVYRYDEQVGYVSLCHLRTYRGYNVRLRASAMSLEQYHAHCSLYSERSPTYLKDSRMFCTSLLRASPQMADPGDDDGTMHMTHMRLVTTQHCPLV